MQAIDYSGNKSYNITTNGTTSLPGSFVLIAIVVNTKGASSNNAKIYDNDSTEAGTGDPDDLKGTLDTVNTLGRVEYGIPMYKGIYIVLASGTAADLTVVYRDM